MTAVTLARGCSPTQPSVALVRILGVDDFDVSEGEETLPSVHLSFPLTADVHARDLHDVADLRTEGRTR